MDKLFMGNFGFLNASLHAPNSVMKDLDIKWTRPHPGPFIWGIIEEEKGKYDWSKPDDYVKKAQALGLRILATIWPFAEWDQKVKSGTEKRAFEKGLKGNISSLWKGVFLPHGREKPTNMKDYRNFVRALVGRYDGDGINDMPGLKYPIRHWEVGNEPSFQMPRLAFFIGSPSDYYQVLKVTYEVVKSVDEEAQVLNGGVAHMRSNPKISSGNPKEFWDKVLSQGGGNFFDIANIHSLGIRNESNVPEFAILLKKHGIKKSIWVTETSNYIARETDLNDKNALESHAAALIKSYIKAFANGAEVIFYSCCCGFSADKHYPERLQRCAIIYEKEKRSAYYAMKTMIKKIDGFKYVEKIAEGIYLFRIKSKSIYVVLSEESYLKNFIKGELLVTNIYGKEQKINAKDFTSSNIPVFVEPI